MSEKPKKTIEKEAKAIPTRAVVPKVVHKGRRHPYHIYTGKYRPEDIRGECPEHLKNVKFSPDKFYEELVFEEVVMRGPTGRAVPIHRIWLVNRDSGNFPCESCGKSDSVIFNIQETGVYRRCKFCNVTGGPEPMKNQDGTDRGELLAERQVSVTEANKILARTGSWRQFGIPIPAQGKLRSKTKY